MNKIFSMHLELTISHANHIFHPHLHRRKNLTKRDNMICSSLVVHNCFRRELSGNPPQRTGITSGCREEIKTSCRELQVISIFIFFFPSLIPLYSRLTPFQPILSSLETNQDCFLNVQVVTAEFSSLIASVCNQAGQLRGS